MVDEDIYLKFRNIYEDKERNTEYRKRIMKVLHTLTNGSSFSEDEREEFINAGWGAVWYALRKYDPEAHMEFETFATHYIKYELLNVLKAMYQKGGVSYDDESTGIAEKLASYDDYEDDKNDTEGEIALLKKEAEDYNKDAKGLALSHRRTLQLLNILMSYTDDRNTLTLEDLTQFLAKYNGKKNTNSTTTEIMRSMVFEMNRTKTRIAYDETANNGRTNYRYVHPFTYEELDHIIEAVVFSGSISEDEKTRLVGGLVELSSNYYETVFYDKRSSRLRTNNNAIFTRTCGSDVSNNVKAIQEAVNSEQRITFRYNDYSADKQLVPRSKSYKLSPHQIVVYHDMYYLIGSTEGSDRLSHYRIDLMSEITPAKDGNGNIKKRESMVKFKELRDKWARWQPDKYMSEHLYMDYDSPRLIRIKIKNDQYRVLHDWFGDHFEKSFIPCEDEGYDYVNITTSPKMIVYWAMQYSDVVEIMDEEVREKIREEASKLAGKYGKNA